MAMRDNGLCKLSEECGELIQIVGKMLQYPELQWSGDPHPDGTVLRDRLEEELADVAAALGFVAEKLGLNIDRIADRTDAKYEVFERWDREPG